MNLVRIQDRKSRHDYLRIKNDKKAIRSEVDMMLKAWAAFHYNDSREIANETKYKCILGILYKGANEDNNVHSDLVHMYEPEFLQDIDNRLHRLNKRQISIIVNCYRVFIHLDREKSEIVLPNDSASDIRNKDASWMRRCKLQKKQQWCKAHELSVNSYAQILSRALDSLAKEVL